ncbi:MAG: PAS domain S-box protein [Bacteroidetes bacterium]|nr:PAS domain S-box protein [Bacteroidota bacterium]
MQNLLKPKHLNIDHIFGRVLLALNDSFCIAELDDNASITFSVHPSFWENLNFPDQEEHQKVWYDCIEDPQRDQFLKRCETFYQSKESAFTMHIPMRTYTNHKRWYIAQVVRLGENIDKKQSFLYMLKDISLRIREKDLLEEGQKILKMGFWEMNFESKSVFWSKTTRQIHGVSDDYVPNLEDAVSFYKEGKSRELIKKHLEACYEKGTPFEIEAEIVQANGKSLWVESRGKVDFEDGKCVRLYGTFQDISKRKKVENDLRISEESFRGAFQNATIGMALLDPKGNWLKVNESLCKMVGYTSEELTNITFEAITHPEDVHLDNQMLRELKESKFESYQVEKRYYHKNGHLVWLISSVSMVKKEDGSPEYFILQLTDITERKLAFDQVINANKRIQGIIDASTYVSIISTTLDGTIVEFNKGAENLLGYSASDVIDKVNFAQLHLDSEIKERGIKLSSVYGKRIEDFEVFVHKAKLGFHDSGDWTVVRKDGAHIAVQLVVTAIRNSNNEIVGFLGMATDLTERKRAESLLNKMAILESKSKEMEQFAYITSHDLREPLLTITNYISLIQSEFSSEMTEQAQQFFNYILAAGQHLTQLINGLLEYSRLSNVSEKEEVDLQKVIHRVVANLEGKIKQENAIIRFENLPIVRGYENHLYILLQNLIQNALKFKKPDVLPEIEIRCYKKGEFWIVSVQDNGIGLSNKYVSKIFTIFQRLHNKNEYEGTGLGLALANKVCELHGGKIWVESKENQGSTFNFSLPV